MTVGPASDPPGTRAAVPTRPSTIYDVARLAGVSHQTVSRFVKGSANISPQTRERVEQALAALDYRPNLVARSLATSRSRRLVAITRELHEVGPSRIVQGASRGARDAGYLLDIVSLDPNDDRAVAEAVRLVDQQDLAGIIAFASTDGVTEAFRETTFSVPTVVDGRGSAERHGRGDAQGDAQGDDDTGVNDVGVRMLIDHLVSLGHRRIFQVSGPLAWGSARARSAAFARALAAHGLESAGTIEGDWSPASGYRAGTAVPLDAGVTALVVANDQMALGAVRALVERGIRVPEQVSVVGFDDIAEAAYFLPPLTTVRVDFDSQGRAAIGRLITLVEGADVSPPVPVAPELVVRSSTAAAAG